MTKAKLIILLSVLAALIYLAFVFDLPYSSRVTDFASCAAAGNPVAESFPRQCRDREGNLYVEKIGEDLSSVIRISSPAAGATVSVPVRFAGEAKGFWFFEGSFPVVLIDSSGREAGRGIARAKGDWMTTEFVSFEGTLAPDGPVSGAFTLVFEKDNPSGEASLDASFSMPVSFASLPLSSVDCVVSGCSGEICADTEMMSACMYKPEYACYAKASCGRRGDGTCGWTKTAEYNACLKQI
ncbi:MAG: Gmad2 immunoglobulin-like domain-containing protein, partial [Candidatus Paceibacterota bacterium]|jgi:eight-cysteine-cluster-containing protein